MIAGTMGSEARESIALASAECAVREIFGFQELRDEQRRALEPILALRDTIVVMPTGSGKSLCFQLPAVLEEAHGATVVISPLIALMKDQVDGLVARGFRAATVNSAMDAADRGEVMARLRARELTFLYVAPERLANPWLIDALRQARVARVAVDEAHCASEWGHDFRPDYLKIGEFLDRLGRPPCTALTATATPRVRADIAHILGLRDPAVIVAGFDRPNLALSVLRVRGEAEREAGLLRAFEGFDPKKGAALVYAGSRKNTEAVGAILKSAGKKACVYHAGLGADERTRVQEDFIERRLPIVAATNAFGMGIDRADVRLVVHWDMPGSLEAYYQEIGRAGRDGLSAQAILLFSEASVMLQEFFLNTQHTGMAVVRSVLDRLRRDGDGVHTAESIGEAFKASKDEASRHGAAAALSQLIIADIARRGVDGRLTVDLERAARLDDLVDAEALDRRREHGRSKLASMTAYGRRRSCRRNTILDYFEAEREVGTCGRCDVCAAALTNPNQSRGRVLEGDELLLMQKILAGVARARGRAGRQKIVGMLTGSGAKEIKSSWLAGLSTYGLLAHLPAKTVAACLDALIDSGLVEVSEGELPVLALAEAGWDAMNGRSTPLLAWPSAGRGGAPRVKTTTSKGAPKSSSARVGANEDETESAGEAGLSRADPAAEELVGRLRLWRRRIAEAAGIPAYVVFPDRSLADLARVRPQTLEELLSVHGFGPSRAERYGPAILRVIDGDDPGPA